MYKSLKSIQINISNCAVVETFHETRHRLGNGGLEVFDELVRVLVQELVHGLCKTVGFSAEQVLHLDVEPAQLNSDVWITIDDKSAILNFKLSNPIDSGEINYEKWQWFYHIYYLSYFTVIFYHT